LLIHRDIKPANVLVGTDGRVKLLDFGIARLRDQTDVLSQSALTPGYASPEQWAGGEITVASDVYQVGLLLAVLLDVLDPATQASHATCTKSERSMVAQPVTIDAARMSHLPRDLAAIVAKATAVEPEQRYATVAALGDDLQRWLQQRPVTARQGGLGYRLGCAVRRHPVVSTGALLSAIALLTLGARLAQQTALAQAEATRAELSATRATEQARLALDEAARARAAQDFLAELLKWAKPTVSGGEPVTVDTALARGVTQLATQLHDQPRLRAELLHLLGDVYVMRQETEKARPLVEDAHALMLEHLDPREPARVLNTFHLAVLLGKDDVARRINLLDEVIRYAGALDEVRVGAMRTRASMVYRTGDIHRAKTLMAEALAEADRVLPPERAEHAQVRNNLAGYLGDLGDHAAALELKQAGYDAALKGNGAQHPVTSLAAASLSRTLLAMGRVEAAQSLLEEQEDVRLKLWGPAHTQYGVQQQNMARLRLAQGRLAEAERAIRNALAISRSTGATGRFHLASQYADLGEILLAQERAPEATGALHRALDPELRKEAVVLDFGAARVLLARALRRAGRHTEIPAQIEQLRIDMAPLPAAHIRQALLAIERAHLAQRAGETDASAALAQQAIEVLMPLPPTHVRLRALGEACALLQQPGPGKPVRTPAVCR
jgi:serine/threonine-protein kinase